MKRLQVWMPLLFSVVLILGMFIGSALRSNVPSSRGIFNSGKRSVLQEVMDLLT